MASPPPNSPTGSFFAPPGMALAPIAEKKPGFFARIFNRKKEPQQGGLDNEEAGTRQTEVLANRSLPQVPGADANRMSSFQSSDSKSTTSFGSDDYSDNASKPDPTKGREDNIPPLLPSRRVDGTLRRMQNDAAYAMKSPEEEPERRPRKGTLASIMSALPGRKVSNLEQFQDDGGFGQAPMKPRKASTTMKLVNSAIGSARNLLTRKKEAPAENQGMDGDRIVESGPPATPFANKTNFSTVFDTDDDEEAKRLLNPTPTEQDYFGPLSVNITAPQAFGNMSPSAPAPRPMDAVLTMAPVRGPKAQKALKDDLAKLEKEEKKKKKKPKDRKNSAEMAAVLGPTAKRVKRRPSMGDLGAQKLFPVLTIPGSAQNEVQKKIADEARKNSGNESTKNIGNESTKNSEKKKKRKKHRKKKQNSGDGRTEDKESPKDKKKVRRRKKNSAKFSKPPDTKRSMSDATLGRVSAKFRKPSRAGSTTSSRSRKAPEDLSLLSVEEKLVKIEGVISGILQSIDNAGTPKTKKKELKELLGRLEEKKATLQLERGEALLGAL